MRIQIKHIGKNKGYRTIIVDEDGSSFGVLIGASTNQNEVVERIKKLKVSKKGKYGLDEWNLNHFLPLQKDKSYVKMITDTIWKSEYNNHYLLYGPFFVLKDNQLYTIGDNIHSISKSEVSHLPHLSFWLLFNLPDKHLDRSKISFLQEGKDYKVPKPDVSLNGTDFYIKKHVIIAKRNGGKWVKFYHVEDGDKFKFKGDVNENKN